ncbi:preprotein translocase subunit YajC [Aeromicrobium sp. IC_218]|uniref:preprotein translocase subunit YajC n=1 Tax=Aeromicrobium sp. IC_218 TaxID=2545468 RepID=UPI00103EE19C|nr:preprotein translocase subunit YajC [Aeromicrobium sp. IC_218]TCI99855.1 preprotein translocase subunit YajC [Aeromicrobium sp. IC_218]
MEFLPLVLLVLVFWLLVLRPSRKRQQEAQRTQAALEPGAKIMLTSGLFGTVVRLDDSTLQLELAPGTVVEVHRQAIARVVTDEPAPTETSTELPATDDER